MKSSLVESNCMSTRPHPCALKSHKCRTATSPMHNIGPIIPGEIFYQLYQPATWMCIRLIFESVQQLLRIYLGTSRKQPPHRKSLMRKTTERRLHLRGLGSDINFFKYVYVAYLRIMILTKAH